MRVLIKSTKLRKEKLGGMAESTFWLLRKNKTKNFPKPVPLGPQTLAWWNDEVDAWLEAQREKAAA